MPVARKKPPARRPLTDASVDTLFANRIVIPYPDGRPALELGLNGSDRPHISLYGKQGNEGHVIVIEIDHSEHEGEGASILIQRSFEGGLSLDCGPSGEPTILLTQHKRPRQRLELAPERLRITHDNREPAIQLELTREDEGTPDEYTTPNLTLTSSGEGSNYLNPSILSIQSGKHSAAIGVEFGPFVKTVTEP